MRQPPSISRPQYIVLVCCPTSRCTEFGLLAALVSTVHIAPQNRELTYALLRLRWNLSVARVRASPILLPKARLLERGCKGLGLLWILHISGCSVTLIVRKCSILNDTLAVPFWAKRL